MNAQALSKKVWQDPVYFIAFGFGSGLIPGAPGTWGTVAAVPLYLLLASYTWPVYLVITLVAFVLGVVFCNKVSREMGVNDYQGIVWDEVVGYLMTMFMAPPGWVWVLLGFVLFRLFDIWKPQPIRLVDKHVHGGLGIMLDDAMAAVPACLILHALAWVFVR